MHVWMPSGMTFVERADLPDDPWMLLERKTLAVSRARNPDQHEQLAERFQEARSVMSSSFETWVGAADRPLPSNGERATLVLALLYGLEMQRRVDPTAIPNDLAVHGLRVLFGIDDRPDISQPPSKLHEREQIDAH